MCLFRNFVLCSWEVDLWSHLVQYKTVGGIRILFHIWFTAILHLLSYDLVCSFLLLWKTKPSKMSILFTCLAQIFLCQAGEAECMSGITTFGAVILTAMSRGCVFTFSIWWLAFFGLVVFFCIWDLSSYCVLVQYSKEGWFGLHVHC